MVKENPRSEFTEVELEIVKVRQEKGGSEQSRTKSFNKRKWGSKSAWLNLVGVDKLWYLRN